MRRLLYIFLFLGYSASAQETLTLSQAIETGLKNNYSIVLSRNEEAKAKNNFTLGNAGMLPRLDALLIQSNSITDTRQEFATGNIVDRNNAEANSLNASVDLTWTVFDGFSMFASYKMLKEFRNAGELNARLAVEDAVQQIINAYFDVVKQQALLQVIDSSRKISDIKLNIARTKFEIGAASKIPFLQAQVDRNADESAYKKQLVTIAAAKILLNQLLGRTVDTDFIPADTISVESINTLQKALDDAAAANTSLRLANSDVEISRLSVKEFKGGWLPYLDLNAGYDFTRSNSEAGIVQENRSSGYNYGFTIGWNLFNGFNQSRIIRNAKLDYQSSEIRLKEITNSVNAEVRTAYLQAQSNIEIVNLEQQNTLLARENIDLSIERYRTGLTDELQFKEAQQSYVEAFSRLISAQYDARLTMTNLNRLTGNLIQ